MTHVLGGFTLTSSSSLSLDDLSLLKIEQTITGK